MTALEQLKLIIDEVYVDEDEEEYSIELKPPLTDHQINQLADQLPARNVPAEIRQLLKFAGGFEFSPLQEITFDGVGVFGFENVFPHSIQLAGDGFGNFWVLDVDSKGNWGHVFYVCHNPPVIVKHSQDLTEFIKHVHEFGKSRSDSNLDTIHERISMDIWKDRTGGFIDLKSARNSNDNMLRDFASQLPDNFVIADLRNKPNQTGFAWAKFGPDVDNAIRYNDQLLWGFEHKKQKGFLSKLFGG